ncbi:unnamed protein product [Caenorhabditis brenneri]
MLLQIFFGFLVFMTSGKPVEKPDCESEQAVLTMLNCTATLLEMIETTNTHPTDHQQMKMYLEDCEHFLSCDQSYQCQNNKKYSEDIKNHKTKCTANIFILKEFRDCEAKLRAANSTCYQDYNPFSTDDMIARMVKEEKEDCGKFFMEDDCMIKETIKMCGKKQGARYQKELRNLAKAFKICDSK